jgi:anti-sigma-K factor RskA
VYPQATGEKNIVTFPQGFSHWGRKKVQRVSTSPEELRVSFLHYIMGRMPEPERTRFEEHLLEDQDFSDAAAVCEQELIDAYALHRLNAEETKTVGLWIEASPRRVERVAIARTLLLATPQQGLRRRQIGIVLAAAACVFMAATLYLVNTKVLHHGQKPTLSAANTPPAQIQTPTAATSSEAARPDIVLIAAERVRGKQESATYQVHRERPIQLQVVLPGQTARSGYQVRLTLLANQSRVLLQQDNLEAQTLAGQLYLTVTLPPGSLPPATYTASVTHQGNTLISTFTLKWVHN